MVRLPCTGKTTAAKQMEYELQALRLTPDEWHLMLFGMDFEPSGDNELHNRRHETIERLMWSVAQRALELGLDVILDFGFWSRSERDEFRGRAHALGAASQLHYTTLPTDVHHARLIARNAMQRTSMLRFILSWINWQAGHGCLSRLHQMS